MAKKKKEKEEDFLSGRELALNNAKRAAEGCSCSKCTHKKDCSDHHRYLENLERIHCSISVLASA